MTPALAALERIEEDIIAIYSPGARTREAHAMNADLALLRDQLVAAERDAALWRAFNNDALTYFKVELENRRTGELVKGEVQWEIYWRGPDRALFQDAVAEAAKGAEG